MKRAYTIRSACSAVLFVLLVLLVTAHNPVLAQAGDTLLVKSSPAGNLNVVIQGDTLVNGIRAHPNRTYKLYRDSIYYFNATINVNFPLAIIADTGSHRPPVIALAILQDGSSPTGFLHIFSNTKKLTLKNLYITGVRPDQKIIPVWDCIAYNSDSTNSVYNNCVFESYGGAISDNAGKYNKFTITDCKFRNMMDYGSWFEGNAFFGNSGTPTDTVVMVNNTMFCNNSYANCNVDYNVFTRFEHNTVFLNCVNPLNDFVMTNAVYKNNIFYGTLAEAQDPKREMTNQYFENSVRPSSTFSFDSLNTMLTANEITTLGLSEGARKLTVLHNSVYWPAKLKTFWQSALMDTLIPPVFLNVGTFQLFTNKAAYPFCTLAGNDTLNDPGFPASVMGQVDSLIKFVTLTRTGGLGSYLWNYRPNGNLFAPVWPVPENLAYTNTTMQHEGTDGFALGDLNWFPTQKAAWLLTGIAPAEPVPQKFSLSPNYPNPFNPSTTIDFTLPKAAQVQLKVYNLLGQEVATLVNGTVAPGSHSVKFNGTNLASGVYLYKIVAGDFVSTRKMLLLK
jgi:hypothetical protein